MTPDPNAVNGPAEPQGIAPARMAETRPLYWSIRRELWENRSLHIAPLIVACVAVFAYSVGSWRLPRTIQGMASLDAAQQAAKMFKPYSLAGSVILFTSFVVGAFYCLDALYGERRDRSILFWKSLPVSDRTTVLSKAAIPLAILPLQSMLIAVAVDLAMLLLGTLALVFRGVNPMLLWERLPLVTMTTVMVYGVTAHVLWFAPLYAWILLVSAWARRTVILWVVLPSVAIGMLERMLFGTRHFASLIRYRLAGPLTEAFGVDAMKTPVTRLSQLTPVEFLTRPGLWAGLLFAAACIAAAVRLRRNREPV